MNPLFSDVFGTITMSKGLNGTTLPVARVGRQVRLGEPRDFHRGGLDLGKCGGFYRRKIGSCGDLTMETILGFLGGFLGVI